MGINSFTESTTVKTVSTRTVIKLTDKALRHTLNEYYRMKFNLGEGHEQIPSNASFTVDMPSFGGECDIDGDMPLTITWTTVTEE